GKMFGQPATGPIAAVREKREYWEILMKFVVDEMARGTAADAVADKLLASAEFKTEFLDRMDPRGWQPSEMRILVRRVATYTETGR
ncbi:MAG: hypothetical protein HKN56_11020, partial [Gammaproteobacteria bacterium]|nr:hypothetical protein [Gammaproteobacteria bacterium]